MKAKILRVSPELLVQFCKRDPSAGWALDSNSVPDDARVTGVIADVQYEHCVLIRLESETWPEVPFAAQLEFVPDPTFRRIPQPGWTDPAA